MTAMTENAQQDPHVPWFLTLDSTFLVSRQSRLGGRDFRSCRMVDEEFKVF